MENQKSKFNDPEKSEENVNFQMYFDMVKNNEMSWKLFIQIMKDMLNFLDLKKSKELIFYFIEELKGFIEREAEYMDKQQLTRISELEESNAIFRKENESLKEEREELQKKLSAIFGAKRKSS